ncbi:uncharacterized protein LOC119722748 [Patiria miniata]|uniref:Nerve growth factor-related domain-containing protein n=1 Tax=Patiria miniata TaxID=46514 RepID=A0A913ZD51_PATMI|nr:uncharacterized protein LOC119722748 [Patiria miniata]
MHSLRVTRVPLSLQVSAFLALSFAVLVGARYTPSKFYNEMPEYNEMPQPNTDVDSVQQFLDILRIPSKLRPLSHDFPTMNDFMEMPSMEGADAQRVAFSESKPDYTPAIEIPLTARDRRSLPYPFYKRSVVNSEETVRACEAQSDWEQITRATALENEDVILGTRQWFWQTTCSDEEAKCYGFKETPHMTSSCRPVFSWVVAWARPASVMNYTWRFIALKTCCSCAVIKTSSNLQ